MQQALGISLFFALAACKSAPPAAPEPPPQDAPVVKTTPAFPEKALLDQLDGAENQTEAARKRALDFGAPVYLPPDWEGAESRYQALKDGTGRETREDVQAAISRYGEMEAAYEGLFRRSVPLYAEEREREILEARAAAVHAGAEVLLPDYLILADETALEALSRYEGEDYYPAADSAALALDQYRALKTGAEAYEARLEIETRDFYRYDPENFGLGDESGDAAIAAYESEDPLEAQNRAEEALHRYNLVLDTGREKWAADREVFATGERQAALELKANVAVRRDFADADEVYNRAGLALREKNYDLAANLYEEAGFLFILTQRDTMEKRRIAGEALLHAEEKMNESDELARNAELILEGGAQ